jgi:hypothetical protein
MFIECIFTNKFRRVIQARNATTEALFNLKASSILHANLAQEAPNSLVFRLREKHGEDIVAFVLT